MLTLSVSPAFAQSSVTLYGIVDGGLVYKTNADAGGHSVTAFGAGTEQASRFGFDASEALGQGWFATMKLENGFFISNGQIINSGILFNRGSTVGLKNAGYGWLQLGRNWIPFHDSLSLLDVANFGNFGTLSNLSYQNLSATRSGLTGAGFYWANNSARYTTPNIHGFVASALYSFGGTAGDFQNRSLYSALAHYQAGNLLIVGSYFSAKDPSGLTNKVVSRAFTAGVKYEFASTVTASLALVNFKDPATGDNQTFYTLGTRYQATPALAFIGDYIHLQNERNSHGNGDLFKIALNYSLSKRTLLYADAGYTRNSSQGTLGVQNTAPVGLPGANQTALAIGITSKF
ncbi:porin [Paraburkholderia sp. ZP32-5]|uniref:porin n=1 Tax=Paraburkholderia sp. ZP32-5 TaxID=2883245 RepID=UPI001F3598CE|nr:porin [Paraburkholderia sp. ZP32-5]